MHAEPGASGTKYAKMAQVVCDIVAEGGEVSEDDMALIEREIMPREVIMRQYHLYQDSMHPVVSTGHGEKYIHTGSFSSWETGMKYGFAWTLGDKGEVVRKLFLSLSADNPLLAAKILFLTARWFGICLPGESGICPSFLFFTEEFLVFLYTGCSGNGLV